MRVPGFMSNANFNVSSFCTGGVTGNRLAEFRAPPSREMTEDTKTSFTVHHSLEDRRKADGITEITVMKVNKDNINEDLLIGGSSEFSLCLIGFDINAGC